MFGAALEDYVLEELPENRTRFTYAVYAEFTPLYRAVSCLLAPVLRRMFYRASISLQVFVNNSQTEDTCPGKDATDT